MRPGPARPARPEPEGTVLGIDVGGTKIAAALVRPSGHVMASTTAPTPLTSAEVVMRRVEELAGALLVGGGERMDASSERLDARGERVDAIGIGLPGVIDSAAGVAVAAANLPWANTEVAARLASRFGVPTFIDNDANAGALGEKWFGAGRGVERFVYVSIGTGVGSGIVVDGRLLPGRHGHGSELGHTIVDVNGPPCGCGSRGCLETLAAGPSMTRRMRERYGRDLTGREVFAAAARGDPEAGAVLAETVKYLAIGVINAWRLLTPDLVIIGGGVARAGDQLAGPLRAAIAALAPADAAIGASVVLSRLDGRSGVLGAAALALEGLGDRAREGGRENAR